MTSTPTAPFLSLSHRRPFGEKLNTSLRKRWFAKKRTPGPDNTRQCRYFETDFIVSMDDEVGYEIALNRFEWRELKLMLDACERLKPELFLDVGANLGLYTCVLGRHHAVPRIVSFEPDRLNFERLSANLKLNKLEQLVEVHQAGAGAKAGTATLVPAGANNRGVSRIETSATDRQEGYEVKVVALDDIVRLHGSRIAAKIDVEGHELEVLTGAAQLFTRNGGFAQIEAHTDKDAGVIKELMAAFGWRFVERYGLDVRFEKP
jgi:FkbM family methyltransferase